MPLLLSKRIDQQSAYAVWKISETNDQLEELHEERPQTSYHVNKYGEWLATRILIKNLCGRFKIPYRAIAKDEYGKPFLVDSPAHISLSHSFPLASAMIDLKKPCGIDVEWPRKKMTRIQDKFLHESEYHHKNDETALCIIWAAKEAIYKQHGKKQLSFKQDLRILWEGDRITGENLRNNPNSRIELVMEEVKDYYLVYSR